MRKVGLISGYYGHVVHKDVFIICWKITFSPISLAWRNKFSTRLQLHLPSFIWPHVAFVDLRLPRCSVFCESVYLQGTVLKIILPVRNSITSKFNISRLIAKEKKDLCNCIYLVFVIVSVWVLVGVSRVNFSPLNMNTYIVKTNQGRNRKHCLRVAQILRWCPVKVFVLKLPNRMLSGLIFFIVSGSWTLLLCSPVV